MKAYNTEKRCSTACIPLIPVFLIIIFFSECNTTEPPPGEKPTLTLKLEDASCTEAWITLTTTNLQLPATVTLKQDNQTRNTINLIKADTLLYIDSLLPNTNYQYQVSSDPQSGEQQQASSNGLTVTTMDTTSHDFTFATYTFGGEAENSVLYDVAIIDENDIWAVGEIYLLDSLGQPDPRAYNAVHWDGNQWEIKRIRYYGSCSAVEYPPLKAIWAFSVNDIIISNGGSIGRFNGNTVNLDCRVNSLLTGAIVKMWGTSNDDLYVVGNNGSIAHYQNEVWSKVESGTNLPFQDIWGAQTNTGEEQILAVASDKFGTGGKYLVKINGNTAEHLNDIITVGVSLSGIWFIPEKKYYLVGDGIYSKHSSFEKYWQFDSIIYKIQYYPYSVRGEGINDVVICADAGNIAHFNGVSWRIYYGETISDRLLSVSIEDSMIIAVGSRYNNGINNNAIIYFGRR